MRVLERESNLKSVSLLSVQRQKANAEYKAAVETLRARPDEGFAKLEAMGAIREVDFRVLGREVSKAYREAAAVPNVKGEAREVLVVAATHNEIKSVTHAIRTDRKAAGEIMQGEWFTNHTALNWTEAQRRQMHKYQPGQVLEFHKAVKGVAKNEALEVMSADRSGITARKTKRGISSLYDQTDEGFRGVRKAGTRDFGWRQVIVAKATGTTGISKPQMANW